MKHVLCTPFYALRIPVAQITDVHFFGDRIQKDCRMFTGGNAKPAAIAPLFVHPHRSNLLVPGKGIPLASRKAVLALDAEERRIDSFFFLDQDFNPGSPRIELLFMRESADLFADAATAAFLMIHIDSWSGLAGYHFRTSILELRLKFTADFSCLSSRKRLDEVTVTPSADGPGQLLFPTKRSIGMGASHLVSSFPFTYSEAQDPRIAIRLIPYIGFPTQKLSCPNIPFHR